MSEAYTVRVHPRARHVRLRVDSRAGLIVTVPPRFDHRRIAGLLATRGEWIEAVRQRQARLRATCDPSVLGARPQRVELPALRRLWRLDYQTDPADRARLHEQEQSLRLSLPAAPAAELDALVGVLLRRWLRGRAKAFLGDELARMAHQHGLSYRDMRIRQQRSRWGSCSASGRISLNARLMFCPPDALQYVLIHELVHTEHLDHSAAFWARVGELMPDYARARLSLREIWQRLPDWA